MKCRDCGGSVGILDERCGRCGADLTEIDLRPRRKKAVPAFDEIAEGNGDEDPASRDPESGSPIAAARWASMPFARVRAAELDVHAEALDVVNLGLIANQIPLVRQLRIRNEAEEPLEDALVRVWLAPEIGESWEATIPTLALGEIWSVCDLTPPLDLDHLARRREAESGHLRLEVREEERVVFSSSQPVRILAASEWIYLPEREWTLASYVFPNHAPVEAALGCARVYLEKSGWGSDFDGYQSGDRAKVRAMLGSVHEALARDLSLSYVNPPASFETTGQKVFMPADIQRYRRGTCLDLALFIAGVLERAGLCPLLFLIPGHAFVGVWADQPWGGQAVWSDKERLRAELDGGGLIPLEATSCTQAMETDQAIRLAFGHIEGSPTVTAIDVSAARRCGALPIALPEEMT